MLHLIYYRGVHCGTPALFARGGRRSRRMWRRGGGRGGGRLRGGPADGTLLSPSLFAALPPGPHHIPPAPPRLPCAQNKQPIGSAFILHACTQLARSCVGTLACLSSWSYVAKAVWPVICLNMMQEAEAQGASESHGRDEGQRPLPDQVSGHATNLLRAAGLLSCIGSSVNCHYQLGSHDYLICNFLHRERTLHGINI